MLNTPVGLAVALSRSGGPRLQPLTIGTSYTATDPGGPSARAILTFKTDGTWTVTVGAGDTPAGTPTSGTWLPAGAVASDYELKNTITAGPSGIGTVSNDAAAFTAISVDRAVYIDLVDVTPTSDAITVTADLRKISNPTDAVQKTGIVLNAVIS